MNIFQITKKYLEVVQYLLILAIALILPYWSLYPILGVLVLPLFITTLLLGQINIKKLFFNKVFVTLSLFILFTYISVLWSQVNTDNNMEYELNILRFKYYFLLIPSIYFASLNIQQIKIILLTSAIAPIGISLLYYSNALGLTNIYSFMTGGESHFFMHYLICNFFLLFSSLYFSLLTINSFIKKEYKYSLLYFLATLFFTVSMVIDPLTTARLTTIVYLIVLLLIPLLYLKKSIALVIIIILLLLSSIFITNNKNIMHGYSTAKLAITNDVYTSSWGHRLGFAIVGLRIFKEHPIIGRGITDVRRRTIKFAKNNPKYFIHDKNRHFHNEHINILVEVGIVGYLLFLLSILFLIKTNINNTFFNNIKYIFIFAFILMMLGEHYLSILNTSFYFSFFIGIILLYKRQEDISTKTYT